MQLYLARSRKSFEGNTRKNTPPEEPATLGDRTLEAEAPELGVRERTVALQAGKNKSPRGTVASPGERRRGKAPPRRRRWSKERQVRQEEILAR